MGLCLPCLGGQSSDYDDTDPEERRRRQLEAAEKRMAANTARGVKDPEGVERKKRRMEEQERLQRDNQGGGGLKWTVG